MAGVRQTTKNIFTAASEGDVTTVEQLLVEGVVDVNAADPRQHMRSALTHASVNGHDAVVMLLLKHGAQIDFRDEYRQTPLMLASSEGRALVVELLLANGANAQATDNFLNAAVTYACFFEHHELTTLDALLLRQCGVTIFSTNLVGHSPLFYGATQRPNGVVPRLLMCSENLFTLSAL